MGQWRAAGPGTRLTAKTRYRQADAACVVIAVDGDRFELAFDEPQWAVTPGQSAVLYREEASLGGGVIESASMTRLHRSPALGARRAMSRKALFFTLSLSVASGAGLVACGGGEDAAPVATPHHAGAVTQPESVTDAAPATAAGGRQRRRRPSRRRPAASAAAAPLHRRRARRRRRSRSTSAHRHRRSLQVASCRSSRSSPPVSTPVGHGISARWTTAGHAEGRNAGAGECQWRDDLRADHRRSDRRFRRTGWPTRCRARSAVQPEHRIVASTLRTRSREPAAPTAPLSRARTSMPR